MKLKTFLTALAATAAIGASSVANAAATISYQLDGGAISYCADNDVTCDINPLLGAVTVSTFNVVFAVNVMTGVSKPIFNGSTPDVMDLNSINVNMTGGTHDLIIGFSDTGFAYTGTIFSGFGGTMTAPAGSAIIAAAYCDSSNALWGQGGSLGQIGPFGSGAFSGTTSGLACAGTYSLTQYLTLHMTGAGSFSGDYNLQVPEPGTLALLGLGLAGLGLGRRRKQ